MLITSHFFLLYFFPVFLAIYYIFRKKITLGNCLIILASLLFYASFGVENLPILIVPLVFDYYLATAIYKTKNKQNRKFLVGIGIFVNIALLGYFKYANFFENNLLLLFPTSHFLQQFATKIVAPVGISFITFQRISYIMDVYRNKIIPSRKFLDYVTYACLFPHLLSGPIVRFSQIKDQIKKRIIDPLVIFEASKFFTIGLAFKILIADQLFSVEELFTTTLALNHLLQASLLLVFFTFRIYMDFLGYSLMAIGLAKFMGFDFPANFSSPYQAISITDFWRRWNITLSNWLRDYLYIPLGGNRKGNKRTYLNLFLTMLLAGLWHGASWNFALWGGMHGTYLIIERICVKKGIALQLPKVARVLYSFTLVAIAWVVFKFTTLLDLGLFLQSMGRADNFFLTQHEQNILFPAVPSLVIAILWSFFMKDEMIASVKPSKKIMLLLSFLFLFALCFSLIRRSVPFIYFQF